MSDNFLDHASHHEVILKTTLHTISYYDLYICCMYMYVCISIVCITFHPANPIKISPHQLRSSWLIGPPKLTCRSPGAMPPSGVPGTVESKDVGDPQHVSLKIHPKKHDHMSQPLFSHDFFLNYILYWYYIVLCIAIAGNHPKKNKLGAALIRYYSIQPERCTQRNLQSIPTAVSITVCKSVPHTTESKPLRPAVVCAGVSSAEEGTSALTCRNELPRAHRRRES